MEFAANVWDGAKMLWRQPPRKRLVSALHIVSASVLLLACFLLFLRCDLPITGHNSLKYLQGHFLDFYDVSLSEYLPSIYVVLAVFNLPLKVLGLESYSRTELGYAHLYFKLFPLLMAILCCAAFWRLVRQLGGRPKDANWATLALASSPMFLYSPLYYGQYDAAPLFLTLLGMTCCLQARLLSFALLFGLAGTFKYFPLFIFVPVLLLVEKRPLRLALYCGVMLLPYLVEIAVYLPSAAFRYDVLGLQLNKRLFEVGIEFSEVKVSLFFLTWFFICGYAYLTDPEKERLGQWAVYIALCAVSVLFATVLWHPQWLMLWIPFAMLAAIGHRNTGRFLYLELPFVFAFVGFCAIKWRGNVDENLLWYGVLGLSNSLESINPSLCDPQATLTMSQIFAAPGLSEKETLSTYWTLMVAVFALGIWAHHPARGAWLPIQEIAERMAAHTKALKVRFYGGVSLFVLPAVACLLAPHEGGEVLDVARPLGEPLVHAGSILGERSVGQVFRTECDRLTSIRVRGVTFGRMNRATYSFVLSELDGEEMFRTQIQGHEFANGEYLRIDLDGLEVNAGACYKFEFASRDATPTDSIALERTTGPAEDPALYALIGETPQEYSLVFRVYGTKNR